MISISKEKKILIETIKSANDFIWIIAFQFTDEYFINLLEEKQNEGVDVRIITLPIDSYSDITNRDQLIKKHKKITNVFYTYYEIGDPSLTQSSRSGDLLAGGGNKWYSLHGKFIVTEKRALILSANLDVHLDWEVYAYFDSQELIDLFKRKYTEFYNNFCQKLQSDPNITGNLYNKLPRTLQDKFLREARYLIPAYDSSLVTEDIELTESLNLSPFDGVAINFLYKLIEDAETTLRIAGETLTDDRVIDKLLAKKIHDPKVDIRIIIGRSLPRDGSKKEALYKNILLCEGSGIDFRTMDDWHAKVWISDKAVVVGSANLNPINLGISNQGRWKANTETLFISENANEIRQALDEFDRAFILAQKAERLLLTRSAKDTQRLLKTLGIARSSKDAKSALANISVFFSKEQQTHVSKIIKYSQRIKEDQKSFTLSSFHITCGVILWKLELTSLAVTNIKSVVREMLKTDDNVDKAILFLSNDKKIIEVSDGVVRIDLQRLL